MVLSGNTEMVETSKNDETKENTVGQNIRRCSQISGNSYKGQNRLYTEMPSA